MRLINAEKLFEEVGQIKPRNYEWICSLRQEYDNDMDFLTDILAILAEMHWRTD